MCGCQQLQDSKSNMGNGHTDYQLVPTETQIMGISVDKQLIICQVYGNTQDRVILFIGSIHGDEPAGTILLNGLADYIVKHPDLLVDRCVVIVPNANPDGYRANSRFNAHDVDLNRNFPTANRINSLRFGNEGFTEPESQALRKVIEDYPPDCIVSIHQMPGSGCIDYDGDDGRAKRLVVVMAEAAAAAAATVLVSDNYLRVQKLGAKPGSLGSYASMVLGVPIVTLELPAVAGNRGGGEELWDNYGGMLIAAIEN